jgi:hypothetical protein
MRSVREQLKNWAPVLVVACLLAGACGNDSSSHNAATTSSVPSTTPGSDAIGGPSSTQSNNSRPRFDILAVQDVRKGEVLFLDLSSGSTDSIKLPPEILAGTGRHITSVSFTSAKEVFVGTLAQSSPELFKSNNTCSPKLYRYNFDKGSVEEVLNGHLGVVSPDGRRVAYAANGFARLGVAAPTVSKIDPSCGFFALVIREISTRAEQVFVSPDSPLVGIAPAELDIGRIAWAPDSTAVGFDVGYQHGSVSYTARLGAKTPERVLAAPHLDSVLRERFDTTTAQMRSRSGEAAYSSTVGWTRSGSVVLRFDDFLLGSQSSPIYGVATPGLMAEIVDPTPADNLDELVGTISTGRVVLRSDGSLRLTASGLDKLLAEKVALTSLAADQQRVVSL